MSTQLHKFSFKLVFFLALSDMLCSFFSVVGDPSKGFFCYAQGYSTHFFCVASFLWTTTIAFTLHRAVVKHKADVEDFEPMFHLYVWEVEMLSRGPKRVIVKQKETPEIGEQNSHIALFMFASYIERRHTSKPSIIVIPRGISGIVVAHMLHNDFEVIFL
ncbi:unnamed protein product [Lactuca virosa]|uniref:G-protein coupled receptors family 2 profile 2 domain-containing protein n=1 Tax=Lactuca virosa TaxID=75947 RepID=A0AAU9LLL4_9ASTR|nr:unnamed protein product [Lactuca virosa]